MLKTVHAEFARCANAPRGERGRDWSKSEARAEPGPRHSRVLLRTTTIPDDFRGPESGALTDYYLWAPEMTWAWSTWAAAPVFIPGRSPTTTTTAVTYVMTWAML